MTPDDKELLRYVVARYYYDRSSVAQTARTASQIISMQHKANEDDVSDACEFLADQGILTSVLSPLGRSVAYKITADGKLFVERLP